MAHQGKQAITMLSRTWQWNATLCASYFVPALTGIIASLAPDRYADGFRFPSWEGVLSFVISSVCLTIPVSFMFGCIPAAFASGLFCTLLTLFPQVQRSALLRMPLAFTLGCSTAAVWCQLALDFNGVFYGLICGAVAAVFASVLPWIVRKWSDSSPVSRAPNPWERRM